jgi:hypothetical protein
MKNLTKITVSALLVAVLPLSALATTFDDVEDTNNHYLAIEYLVSTGTLEGYGDGTFQPNLTINRAELMKVLVTGQGLDPDADTYNNCFPDVTDEWYARHVCYAKEQGWVEGYPDNTFKPAQTVNKVEAAKMIVGAYGLTELEEGDAAFTDVTEDLWFFPYIMTLTENGVIETAEDTYSPAEGMDRGLTAEYIFRVLVSQANEDEIYTTDYRDTFLTDAGLSDLLFSDPYIAYVFYDGEVYQVESDEYVEIGSNGNASLNLEGYYIMGSKGEEKYTFLEVTLEPDESIKVYTNQGDYSFESEDAVWSNSGETVYLYDPSDNLVDEYSY